MNQEIKASCGADSNRVKSRANLSMGVTTQVWLPSTFWHDHADRELPAGELVREAGHRVLVEVTPEELAEIRSDAAYYSDPSGGPDWEEGGPIRRSAAATVRAIDRLFSAKEPNNA